MDTDTALCERDQYKQWLEERNLECEKLERDKLELLAALQLLEELAGETVAELNAKCGLDNDTTTPTETARDAARAAIDRATN